MNPTMHPTDIPTPELEKIRQNKDESQAIGQFLDWLQNERSIALAEYEDNELFPIRENIEQLLAEYFGVDLRKAEEERRALLDAIRADNTHPTRRK